MCELSAKHETVFVLVIQLQTFQEIFIRSLVFVFLCLAVDGKELFELQVNLIYKKKYTEQLKYNQKYVFNFD